MLAVAAVWEIPLLVELVELAVAVKGMVMTVLPLLEHLIQAAVVVVGPVVMVLEQQAAPALSSLNTPCSHKPYLRSKALPLGNAPQV